MLDWEQMGEGQKLHAYDGHDPLPVCGLESVRRSAYDKFPRTTYVGPMPAPEELVCQQCKMYEREHDPMYREGWNAALALAEHILREKLPGHWTSIEALRERMMK